jgi:hypothetical protein
MLPLKEAIAKLSFHRSETIAADDTQIDTQTSVAAGHLVSTSVTLPMVAIRLRQDYGCDKMVGATGFEPVHSP